MLEAYGSAAAKKPDDIALLGQSEGYVEYNAQGRVVKGHAQPVSTCCCLDLSGVAPAGWHWLFCSINGRGSQGILHDMHSRVGMYPCVRA